MLPEEVTRRELIDTLAGFTRALGVRCGHCHVGEEGQPLSTFDFASDDKVAKRKAREMMRMVNDLNTRIPPSLESRAEPKVVGQCITAGRGPCAGRSERPTVCPVGIPVTVHVKQPHHGTRDAG